MEGTITTQIRIGEEMWAYIKEEAQHLGISQNAFLCVLLSRGKKLWDAEITLHP